MCTSVGMLEGELLPSNKNLQDNRKNIVPNVRSSIKNDVPMKETWLNWSNPGPCGIKIMWHRVKTISYGCQNHGTMCEIMGIWNQNRGIWCLIHVIRWHNGSKSWGTTWKTWSYGMKIMIQGTKIVGYHMIDMVIWREIHGTTRQKHGH